MNEHFATAMGRALALTRGGNPAEATRLLQATLSGTEPSPAQRDAADPPSRGRERRPLGQVIDLLANGWRSPGIAAERRPVGPAIPEGARYESRHHDGASGGRDYRLFVPTPRAEAVRGLVVMLHGCTQTADDFAAGTRMNLQGEMHNLVVVYPEQTRRSNQMGCWNWFRPEDQRRGLGEPALLAGLARELAAEFGVPPDRVFVAGLSAGGAMAAVLGAAYSDVFAAAGIHSGLAPGAARDVASAFAVMRGEPGLPPTSSGPPVPSIVFHGSADSTVVPANADAVIGAALASRPFMAITEAGADGADVTIYRDPDGRTLAEDWRLHGVGHAWSGGAPEGSHTHANGPDASSEMVRFFLATAAQDQT